MCWLRIRTTPQEDNSPPYRFWSWWMVLFCGSGPSGELSWWGIVLGIVVPVGNGWALFLSGGELSSWGVVLEPLVEMETVFCHKINHFPHFFFLQMWYLLPWKWPPPPPLPVSTPDDMYMYVNVVCVFCISKCIHTNNWLVSINFLFHAVS